MQKRASRVLESRQESTRRVAQSMNRHQVQEALLDGDVSVGILPGGPVLVNQPHQPLHVVKGVREPHFNR